MSAAVFVDTGGFFALQVTDDRHHASAVSTFRRLLGQRVPLLTTNHVLGETYTLLVATHGHAAAWRFRDVVLASPALEVVHADAKLESDAWALLRRYDDQAFSFVDGVSFAVMRRRRVQRAVAFDRHFAAAGFARLGVDVPVP